MFKILISDQLSEEGISILKSHTEFQVDVRTGLSESALVEAIGEYDGLLIRSATTVTKKIIDAGKKLKVIGRAGVGIDNVDVEAATNRGIVVMNTPEANTMSTAEHAFSMLLSLARSIPQANASVKSGKWERSKFLGVELFQKTLGIIGLGRIGSEVAKRAQSFNMHVMAYDPFISKEKAQMLNIEVASLDDIYAKADFITLHTPLVKETENLLNAEAFAKIKKGIRIINCARGGLIDEAALCEALDKGIVAGVALDVFSKEPPIDSPLLKYPQVIMTPHLGASTKEAQENVSVDVAKQIVEVLKSGLIINSINAPSFNAESLKILNPYLQLGNKLGLLLVQLIADPLKEIRITYDGDFESIDVRPITLSILKGILQYVLQGEIITIVNASMIAEKRGIKYSETKINHPGFSNSIHIEAVTVHDSSSVEGVIRLPNKEQRIVRINGFTLDAPPEGNLLIMSNKDVPGVIGHVATKLGEYKINIAGMTVGRECIGGKAVTIIYVDSAISKDVLDKLADKDEIWDLKMVKL